MKRDQIDQYLTFYREPLIFVPKCCLDLLASQNNLRVVIDRYGCNVIYDRTKANRHEQGLYHQISRRLKGLNSLNSAVLMMVQANEGHWFWVEPVEGRWRSKEDGRLSLVYTSFDE